MTGTFVLLAAMILDGIVGEPRWLWQRLSHPIVLMGHAVAWCDTRLNVGQNRQAKGVVAMLILASGAILIGWVLSELGWLIELIVLAILLAQKSLAQHVQAVADALRLSLHDGRRAVAQIVGRDTREMDPPAVARAAIESAAENFSDGVIAPAFWFLVGGLPGLLLYKITNTADSMIGYRNEKYADFGRAAARFDDLMNFLPARLTAFLIAVVHGELPLWRDIAADARLHRSPNAGWPEAAVARVLNVALAGPRSYDGAMREFPFVNPNGGKDIGADQIEASVSLIWRVWAICLGLCAAGAFIMG